MNNRITPAVALLVIATGLSACSREEPVQKVTYIVDVEPIMQQHCAECHTGQHEGVVASGFTVESYETVMKGTKLGPMIVPGSPESSSLYRLAAGEVDPSIQMPHGKEALSDAQIETLRLWIEQGAAKD